MLAPEIDWDLCQVCDPCLARQACKTRAIVKIDPDEPPYIELSRCTSCSQCILACGFAAITMKNGQVSNANTSGRL